MEIQKWEYKRYIKRVDWDAVVSGQDDLNAIEQELDSLGDEGWELVTVVPESSTQKQTFYFKRPACQQTSRSPRTNRLTTKKVLKKKPQKINSEVLYILEMALYQRQSVGMSCHFV